MHQPVVEFEAAPSGTTKALHSSTASLSGYLTAIGIASGLLVAWWGLCVI